jgi:hypothetical protein
MLVLVMLVSSSLRSVAWARVEIWGKVSGELPLSLILYFSLSLSLISITSTGSISSDSDRYGHSHMM